MTPQQRARSGVREAMRFMSLADLLAARDDASLPRWARQMYAEEHTAREQIGREITAGLRDAEGQWIGPDAAEFDDDDDATPDQL